MNNTDLIFLFLAGLTLWLGGGYWLEVRRHRRLRKDIEWISRI